MSRGVRQPFGEMSASRMQALTSAKNTQNSITEMLKLSESDKAFKPESFMTGAKKRSFAPTSFDDDDVDTENIDPQLVSSKRFRTSSGDTVKKTQSHYTLHVSTQTMPKAAPFGSSTAPAGRSPKSKHNGILSRKRVGLKPSGSAKPTGVPFSLNSVLRDPVAPSKSASSTRPLSRGFGHKPKSWYFDIHEDTPEEENWTKVMHCTSNLDVSSDEETERRKDSRGKENIPPPGHVPAPNDAETTGSRSRRATKADLMADDVPRSPLQSLNVDLFHDEGLDASSVVVVPGEDDDEEHHATADSSAAQQSNLSASAEEVAQ
ncbi:MAG: hypothetical protein M1828_005064 [Chrysothrix sp. TS-e1954]|nr:MAG: hypothetical protein M1828_005064 [Chrysothrix sp. TS-e1954]